MTIRRRRVFVSVLWASSTMIAAPSYAQPAVFPDLSGYQQVDAAAYGIRIVGSAYVFDTPDGLHCEIAEPHYQPLQFYCTGALPGVPEGIERVGAATIPAEEFAQ
jgi:hypothetical protein